MPEEDLPTPPPAPSPLKQIRTYQGDIAEALKTQQESIVSIQRQEQARSARAEALPSSTEETEEKKEKNRGLVLFISIIFLIIVGGGVSWYAYTTYQAKTALPVVKIVPNGFISSQKMIDLDALSLTKDSLFSLIQTERETNKTPGAITQFDLRTGSKPEAPLVSTQTFLTFLNSRAPGNLVRAFNPLYLLGVVGGEIGHTFLIIKLDSFENAFPGMLSWETDLAEDILPLFTTQDKIDQIPSQTPFKDVSIQNKNIRKLIDPENKTVLLYTFFDNQLLIITDTEETLKTLLNRLDSEKLSR